MDHLAWIPVMCSHPLVVVGFFHANGWLITTYTPCASWMPFGRIVRSLQKRGGSRHPLYLTSFVDRKIDLYLTPTIR